MIHIVGGVYREYCMHPNWREIYGSAGRAASAIAQYGGAATLHAYLDNSSLEVLQSRSALEGFQLSVTNIEAGASFFYPHALSTPTIQIPSKKYQPIKIYEDCVIRFGMIEGDAVVDAQYAVYDPQNVRSPDLFTANGSKAAHLAVVLNRYEASQLVDQSGLSQEEMAHKISQISNAEVVVLKMGAEGALVWENGSHTIVPAYQTSHVYKLGSGDNFVAHFGYHWMECRKPAIESAHLASKATAYYCETGGFTSPSRLACFSLSELQLSLRFRKGYKPLVYLAGPFFTLAELWLVEQARDCLIAMGLRVFSPYHDVGHGSADDVVEWDLKGISDCDIVLAIGDGLDSGTLYEVGYASAIGKPVVFYAENETLESQKMMQGSGSILCKDFVTAIYLTFWTSAGL